MNADDPIHGAVAQTLDPVKAVSRLVEPVVGLAELAGRAIMAVYARSGAEAVAKADGSPLTAADRAADAVIYDGLAALTPAWPVVSEERAASHDRAAFDGPVWLVDPLDGTKEFLDRNGEFTVNIGLVVDRRPLFGVIHAPASALTCWGAVGLGAWRRTGSGLAEPIRCRPVPSRHAVAAVSRRHGRDDTMDAFAAANAIGEKRPCGSALKFCLVAAAEADLYPRFGPTMEWDTAAGHAIILAAGGSIGLPDGTPLLYGKKDLRNPDFIARGAAAA